MPNKYEVNTWEELFSEITYDYELQYADSLKRGIITDYSGVRYWTIYKTTIYENGIIQRKGNRHTFDPKLWYKVELLAQLFMENSTVRTLFGN